MRRNRLLILVIILMAIGFAAVSTTLYINGTANIANNLEDFDVYFSKVYENGIENNNLIKNKTHIVFTTDFININEEYELKYEVTNASQNYNLDISLNVSSSNEYIEITNKFDTKSLLARTSREGVLTIKLIKGVTEKTSFPVDITVNVNAVERISLGTDGKENVNFTKLVLKDEEQIVSDQKFVIELTNNENMLTYNVTNTSREYDIDTTVTCEGENLTLENHFENGRLNGNTMREGKLKVIGRGTLTCTIMSGLPVSRNTLASEILTEEYNTDEIEPFPEPSAVETLLDKINDKNVTVYTNGNIHEMYTFDHEKTSQMPANTDYRYIGDDPYNYIIFNNELWRIIGLIPDENNVYRLKLIRNIPYENVAFDTIHTNESAVGTNSWEHSDIRELMASKVNEEVKEKYVDEVKFFLGGSDYNLISPDTWYSKERGIEVFESTKYPRKTNIQDKVGLMYPSDYAYTFGKNIDNDCYNDTQCDSRKSWLKTETKEWLITPNNEFKYKGYIKTTFSIDSNNSRVLNSARPVVYIKPDIEFKKGDYDGSIDKPYELK